MCCVMSNADAPVLELRDVSRVYRQGGRDINVFEGAALSIRAGETVALTGPSGAGKSSLLHIAGLLEAPSSGDVAILGQWRSRMSSRQITGLRRETIGFVFQFHFLLPEFSALENAALPAMISGASRKQARVAAEAILVQLGLAERLHHRPGTLSGGEQQRVAIARALATKPALILADEPTGNLDPRTGRAVWREMIGLAEEKNCAILAATHNMEFAPLLSRQLTLASGALTTGLTQTGAGLASKEINSNHSESAGEESYERQY